MLDDLDVAKSALIALLAFGPGLTIVGRLFREQ